MLRSCNFTNVLYSVVNTYNISILITLQRYIIKYMVDINA